MLLRPYASLCLSKFVELLGRTVSPIRFPLGQWFYIVDLTERELFIDNLLVRIHRCFWCTSLAPWEFESPFPGSLISTFLEDLTELSFVFVVYEHGTRSELGQGLIIVLEVAWVGQ